MGVRRLTNFETKFGSVQKNTLLLYTKKSNLESVGKLLLNSNPRSIAVILDWSNEVNTE